MFDVLGKLTFNNKSLRELLIEAVRYNSQEDVRQRLYEVVDHSLERETLFRLLDEHAHVTQEQQRQWLLERAERNGFLLYKDGFDVVETKWLKFRKGEAKNTEVTLRSAAFEGMLTITDISLFKDALVNGIGRAKAYGCGLMTLARIRGD